MDVMGLGNKLCRGVIWRGFCIEILPSTEDVDKTLYIHGIDWITKLVQDFCSNSRSSGATSRKVLMFKTAKVQPAVPTELQCQSRMKSCKKKSKRVLNACILFLLVIFFLRIAPWDCITIKSHHLGEFFFCHFFQASWPSKCTHVEGLTFSWACLNIWPPLECSKCSWNYSGLHPKQRQDVGLIAIASILQSFIFS